MSIAKKTYIPPFTLEEIQENNPAQPPISNLIYYAVCGETKVTYSTGAQYQRNDYIYGKFALVNGAQDPVDLRGLVIYRDYDTPPISEGVSDGFYYQLLQTNKGNDIAGIIGDSNLISSVNADYTGPYKDLNSAKFIDNTYHGLVAAGPWQTLGLYYAQIRTQDDLTSFVQITQNPEPEKFHYKYVSRGATIKEGDLVLGETPVAPEDPADYDEGNYHYTFNRWDLSMSGKDHTYTAVFNQNPIILTVIWQNWDGSELQRKTYNKGTTEPSYSGPTPTKPDDTTYTYTFSRWILVSSSGNTTIYKAEYTSAYRTKTVIWQNWNGSELQRKTYRVNESEPTYSGSTPTRPDNIPSSGTGTRYTFSSWTLLSSSDTVKTYQAKYSEQTLYIWDKYSYTEPSETTSSFGWSTGQITPNPITFPFTAYSTYSIINGKYTLSGNSQYINDNLSLWNNYGNYPNIYIQKSDTYILYLTNVMPNYNYTNWTYSGTKREITGGDKGSYLGYVTSTSPSSYPANGVSGSYWYVKR